MPRYFFHCANGVRENDPEGLELADVDAARLQAIRYAGEVLQQDPVEIWHKGQWRVEVADAEGRLLFAIVTVVIDAPAVADGPCHGSQC